MATLGDVLLIKLGIDAEGLKQGLKDAENASENSTRNIASSQEKHVNQSSKNIQAIQQSSASALNTVLGLAKRLAGPVTAALSFGAMIKSYWGGMGQVAQMTGAYYKQLDEWREKMAALRRYTKEDLELYRRTNRAMTDFRIAMADVSAELMRSFSPLFKKGLEALETFTKFISNHKDDVVRFLKVLAGVITTMLIPAFTSWAAAILMNPLTWIIGLVIALAVAIDDLIVYLQGGDAVFGSFWKPCIEFCKDAIEWFRSFWQTVSQSEAFATFKESLGGTWNVVKNLLSTAQIVGEQMLETFKKLFSEIANNGVFESLAEAAISAFGVITDAFNLVGSAIGIIFGAVVTLFTGDTTRLKKAWESFCDSYKHLWDNVVNFLRASIDAIFGLVRSVANTLIDLGHKIAEALNLGRIIDKIKAQIASLIDWMPDILKTDGLKQWAVEVKSKTDQKKATNYDPDLPPTGDEVYIPKSQPILTRERPNAQGSNSQNTRVPVTFDLAQMQGALSAKLPSTYGIMKAQTTQNISNNQSRNETKNVTNNVTINGATPEMTEQTLQQLNDFERNNSTSVGNSTMAVS